MLVAGAIGTYAWALQHWFVGVAGTGNAEHVAVFRGLDVAIVGFDLYELEEETDLAVGDLTMQARNRVRGGITADDEADAARILDVLRDSRLPICPSGGTGKAGDDGTTSSAPSSLPSGTGATPTTTPSRTLGSTSPTTSSPARTASSSEPGVDCREAK